MVFASLVVAALSSTVARAMHFGGQSDACQCLNWKETYAAGQAECGQGFEFTRALGYPQANYSSAQEWLRVVEDKDTLKSFQTAMGGQFCESFYERFDDTKCARTAMDSSPTQWWGKSWCYVSTECGTAMVVANAQVAVKLCEQGKDSLLSDMDPPTLMTYGKKMGFYVPGYFLKVAYPVDRSFFYDEASGDQLAQVKASGQTVLIDKIDEYHDKMIVAGENVYVVPNSYDGFSLLQDTNTSYIIPKGSLICMEGPNGYVHEVLKRLQNSNMAPGWADSMVISGKCENKGYTIEHIFPDTCWSQMTTFLQTYPKHFRRVLSMSFDFVQMFQMMHPELPSENVSSLQVQCM